MAEMNIEIRREDRHSLAAYALVPIAFEIREVVDVSALRVGSALLTCRPVGQSRTKDYDAYPANDPLSWPSRFAVDDWVFLAAYGGRGERVGGAVVVIDADGIAGVGGRSTYAVLWDVRVAPSARGRGIARALLSAAETAARAAGCRGLDAETQDVNTAACRLYASNGYTLTTIVPSAYGAAPTETQLVWSKQFV